MPRRELGKADTWVRLRELSLEKLNGLERLALGCYFKRSHCWLTVCFLNCVPCQHAHSLTRKKPFDILQIIRLRMSCSIKHYCHRNSPQPSCYHWNEWWEMDAIAKSSYVTTRPRVLTSGPDCCGVHMAFIMHGTINIYFGEFSTESFSL